MKENVITVVVPHSLINSNARTTFTTTFRSLCHQYGLKFRYCSHHDALSGNTSLSEPFLLEDSISARFLERIEKQFPRHRIILTTDILKGLHRYVSVISCDPVWIAGEIFSYCVAAGRRRLALFAYEQVGLKTRAYIEAYRETAKLYGCTLQEADVYLNDERQLPDCFSRFYEKHKRYDAVVCANDLAALYLITELRERGVQVPEDLFVFGFGNSPVSNRVTPTITSVAWSEKERAEQCIALWRYLRKYPEVFGVNVTLGHRLVVRESTAGFLPVSEEEGGQPPSLVRNEDRGYGVLSALHAFLQKADDMEKDIVSGLLAGKNNIEIGENLFLSESTVKYHVAKILGKFGVSSRKELCRILQYYNVRL